MKYLIGHYYGVKPPVPEAVQIPEGELANAFEVEVDDLHAFVEKHGPIILSPPSNTPAKGHWWIWVTDHTGRFTQK